MTSTTKGLQAAGMANRTATVRLSFPGEPSTLCTAELRDWTVLERARRAVFALAFFWLLAGIFLPVPPIHWVLVPAFLALGPIGAIVRGTEKTRLETLKGQCPRCKVDRTFKLNSRFSDKKASFSCDQCGNLISLEPG
jgi:hypothetical protein